MIRALQKKFIVTAMIAVTTLILVLVGALNLFNAISANRQTDMLLDSLTHAEMTPQMPGLSALPDPEPPADGFEGFFSSGPSENSRHNATFFLATVNTNGDVTDIDFSRTPSLTEEEAYALVSEALANGETEGKNSTWKFKIKEDRAGALYTYVFLDTTETLSAILRLLVISGLVALLSWCGMLLLVLLLSRSAIRPIAENMEKQKQFVTDAGHEIKTPLAIILANAEALELHAGENKWSRNIKAQTVRLSGLMQDLLTLAKIEERSAPLVKEQTDISLLLLDTAKMFEEGIALKEIQYEERVQMGLMHEVNRPLFSRLCSTLLDNAVKYTPRGGKILLTLAKEEKGVRLSLSNSVENLPSCPPEKLFDRFFRADEARSRESGGYGIGLSAASSIAEAHSGRIFAEYTDSHTIRFTVFL